MLASSYVARRPLSKGALVHVIWHRGASVSQMRLLFHVPMSNFKLVEVQVCQNGVDQTAHYRLSALLTGLSVDL